MCILPVTLLKILGLEDLLQGRARILHTDMADLISI